MIEVAQLRELLTYAPETGALTWLPRPHEMFTTNGYWAQWTRRHAGKPALACETQGYLCGSVLGASHKAHRICWALHYGGWPPAGMEIDHINGDGTDNRIANLRLATSVQNKRNRGSSVGSSSAFKGVGWHSGAGKWRAYARDRHSRCAHLGYFDSERDAAAAHDAFVATEHGEFARLNAA